MSRRRWFGLALFAVVANPIALVMSCSASFGMTDSGPHGVDSMTVYERWTYRFRPAEPGDEVVVRHPSRDGELVGRVIGGTSRTVMVEGRGPTPPGESVSPLETVEVPRGDVEGRSIGALAGATNTGRATAVFVAPWVVGFVMLLIAVAWAERIRRHHEGSSRWWPLPVFLWGIGTLFYAWRMSVMAKGRSSG